MSSLSDPTSFVSKLFLRVLLTKQLKDVGRAARERTSVRDRAARTEDAEMRRVRHALGAAASLVAILGGGAFLTAIPAQAAISPPAWNITARALPSNFTPNSVGFPVEESSSGLQVLTSGNTIELTARNLGTAPIVGANRPITVSVELHGGVATRIGGGGMACEQPAGPCVGTESIEPGQKLTVQATVRAGNPGTVSDAATISGGEVNGQPLAPATIEQEIPVSSAPAPFGIEPSSVLAKLVDASGGPETQAGSHPYALTVEFALNNKLHFNSEGAPQFAAAQDVKDIAIELPAGVGGNELTPGQCGSPVLEEARCSGTSQVGAIHPQIEGIGLNTYAIFNMTPSNGHTNELGFNTRTGFSVHLPTAVRTGRDYGITSITPHVPNGFGSLMNVEANIWGVPGDPSHNPQRVLAGYLAEELNTKNPRVKEESGGHPSLLSPTPFLTMPAQCGKPLVFNIAVDSVVAPGRLLSDGEPDLNDPNWKTYTVSQPPLEGCERLQSFTPHLTVAPATTYSDTPTGTTVELSIPQGEGLTNPSALATPTLQNSKVTLPPGMVANPSQANGLGACQASEDGIGTPGLPSCPGDSKIGTAEIETPLLPDKLTGDVYILQSNPPNLKLLLAASGDGVNVKLLGDVHLDEKTGQLTTTFNGTPQMPFTHFRLTFSGGAQAALVTPPSCGVYASTSDFTPWSSPETPDFLSTNAFGLDSGPAGSACASPLPFAPSMSAGATTDQAGGYTNFSLLLSRNDGEQRIGGLQFKAPPGLSGLLSSVPLCPEPQAAAGTCSPASQIGHTTVGAGAGPAPIYIPELGHGQAPIYLTGPYKGAPFGLSIVVPVLAGPFDLGTVVTRAAISVDPQTAQVTVTTDPLPQILAGIPTNLRQINTVIDHPGFMINPTNCSPLAFSGTARSAQGADAPLSSPFRVGSCRQLRFAPGFTASVTGPTTRGANPRLRAVLTYPKAPPGTYANIAKAQVTLPSSEFLDQSHIRTICTRVQFNAGAGAGANCPPGSIYGHVRATTPLLGDPLEGPVFLRASNNTLPDLVPVLHGSSREPVVIVLDGRVDSGKGGGLRTTFDAVPDAPVSKFVLEMQGGKKGLLVNSTNLCKQKNRAISEFTGQNGKTYNTNPVLAAQCPKKARKGKKTKSTKH